MTASKLQPLSAAYLRNHSFVYEQIGDCRLAHPSGVADLTFGAISYKAAIDCNTQSGRWKLTGRRLVFIGGLTTKIGCKNYSTPVFDSSRASSAGLDRDGLLFVLDGRGAVLLKARRFSGHIHGEAPPAPLVSAP